MNVSGFHNTIIKLLESVLEKYKHESFNRTVCIEIYNSIFETISEIFQTANTPLCNESVNYLAQAYYDSVIINDNHQLDPNIFTQRASLDNIKTQEIALLAVMLSQSGFEEPLLKEIKRRS